MLSTYHQAARKCLLLTAACFGLLLASGNVHAEEKVQVGIVNFKTCVENSKLGKQEQSNLDTMKSQMEAALSGKEKKLNSLADKLNDSDYLDSISPEAETDLKREFRALSGELSQVQSQYSLTLQQAHFKILQKLSETVSKAAEKVAKKKGLTLVLNEESTFYFAPSLEISDDIVKIMDEMMAETEKTESQVPGSKS
ncbi:MAG: hypothetical protein Tsb0021_06200 [Chlamydiales bacterium]